MLCVFVGVSLRRDQNSSSADAGRALLLGTVSALRWVPCPYPEEGGRQKLDKWGPGLGLPHPLHAGVTGKHSCLLPITSLFELHLKLWSPKEHGLK